MRKVIVLLITIFLVLAGCTPSNIHDNSKNESSKKNINSSTDSINNSTSTGGSSMEPNSSSEKNEQQEKTDEILMKSNTKNIDTVILKSYSQEALIREVVFNQSDNFNTLLDLINEKYPVECIRTFENKSLPYCVYKLKEGGLLFIFFHGDSLKFADCAFVVKESLSKSNFDTIKSGKSLDDVEKIDSGLKLYNNIHSENLNFLETIKTYHMIKEGFLIISYKTNDAKTSSNYIPSNFIVESIDFVPNGNVLIDNNKYAFLQNDYPN